MFSSSEFSRADGRIKYRAFLKKGEAELSVDVLDVLPEFDLVGLCDRKAQSRGTNRTFYGWAEVRVQRVEEKCNMKVVSTPTDENPCHADIVFPEQVVADEIKHTNLAHYLAEQSRWRRRPAKV